MQDYAILSVFVPSLAHVEPVTFADDVHDEAYDRQREEEIGQRMDEYFPPYRYGLQTR